jgi:hypothetical protein
MAVTVFALCMLLLVVLPAAFFLTNYPPHRRKYGSKDQGEVRGAPRCAALRLSARTHAVCSLQYGRECTRHGSAVRSVRQHTRRASWQQPVSPSCPK